MSHDPGSLLVSAGLVGEEQLKLARKAATQHGGTVGEHLVLCNFVDDETLTDFYVSRLRVQRASESELSSIAPRLLKLVPPDMAVEFRVLPISVDPDQNLVVAMSDPSNQHAIDEIGFFTSCYVIRKAATQSQVAWGLAHYYAVVTPLARGGHGPDGAPPRVTKTKTKSATPNRSFPRALAGGEPVTGRALTPRPPPTNPPELAPRSGQFTAQPPPREPVRLPAVVVETEDLAEPILLERRARKQFPAVEREGPDPVEVEVAEAGGSSDVLLLNEGMRRARRTSRQTEPGYGSAAAVDSRTDASQDTEVSSPTGPSDAEHQGEQDPVSGSEQTTKKKSRGGAAEKRTAKADKAKVSKGEKNKAEVAEPQAAAPASTPTPPAPAKVEARAKRPSVDDGWDVDDSWGVGPTDVAPTAPAAPAIAEAELAPEPGEVIQAENASAAVQALAPDEDTQRVKAAAAAAAAPLPPPDPAELERSSNRLLDTVRKLERCGSRDQIIDVLLDHLGAACRRRAFFAIKGGQLVAFRQEGAARPGIGTAQMALDGAASTASTFGDVASKRLPYYGNISADALEFVNQALGTPPAGEAVVVPIQMRGRAIALLYGDGLAARVFEEHQMVLGRAAGDALERVVRSAKQN
ncbi:MAG TPA: hypothetical protein VMZ28_20625 [Kofleriaceae bacterium]|nr:hypothetical protein [Kofleriaceae bacterium]